MGSSSSSRTSLFAGPLGPVVVVILALRTGISTLFARRRRDSDRGPFGAWCRSLASHCPPATTDDARAQGPIVGSMWRQSSVDPDRRPIGAKLFTHVQSIASLLNRSGVAAVLITCARAPCSLALTVAMASTRKLFQEKTRSPSMWADGRQSRVENATSPQISQPAQAQEPTGFEGRHLYGSRPHPWTSRYVQRW